MPSMDYYYRALGQVLSHLYQCSEFRTDFDSAKAVNVMASGESDKEAVLQAFTDVLAWMKSEGLVQIKGVRELEGGRVFQGAQLTAKGVELVRANCCLELSGCVEPPTHVSVGTRLRC